MNHTVVVMSVPSTPFDGQDGWNVLLEDGLGLDELDGLTNDLLSS